MAADITIETIKQGLKDREFMIYLQPKYSLSKNRIVGAEALARWRHGEEMISPGLFIPILEQEGCISLIDTFVWEEVAHQQSEWHKNGWQPVPISVNVSREDFNELDVSEFFESLLSDYQLPAHYLEAEITESVFAEKHEAIFKFEQTCKRLGIRLLIDDFGSGISSLNALKDIDADVLKLDMKFLEFNEDNFDKGTKIVNTVLAMARTLGMEVVAEGVETSDQLDALRRENCDVIQGFYFYRPMPVSEFSETMRRQLSVTGLKEVNPQALSEECLAECRIYMRQGKFEEALSVARMALDNVDKDENIELYSDIINALGVTYNTIGNDQMAMEFYLQGLTEALKAGYTVGINRFNNNIGSEYQEFGAHEKAIHYFEKCIPHLETRESRETDDYAFRTFITNFNLFTEYVAVGRVDRASAYMERCRSLLSHEDNASMKESFQIVEALYYIRAFRIDEARAIFEELKTTIYKQEDKSDFWNDMDRLCQICDYFKDYESMEAFLHYMDSMVEELTDESNSIDVFVDVKEHWIHYYEAIGDTQKKEQAELEYAGLCHIFMEQQKKTRIATLDARVEAREREQERERISKRINRDDLTGVGNRYKLENDFKHLVASKDGNGKHLIGVGILDVDYFKEVNDEYGHLQGDTYLKAVATMLSALMNECGGVYRYGGDEFVLLIVDGDPEFLTDLAGAIQNQVKHLNLEHSSSPYGRVTLSQGYLSTEADSASDVWQLLSSADKALYRVKHAGKNSYQVDQI